MREQQSRVTYHAVAEFSGLGVASMGDDCLKCLPTATEK